MNDERVQVIQQSNALATGYSISPDGIDLSDSWLRNRRLFAAPVPSGEHFDSKLRGRISELLGGQRCWAVVLEEMHGLPKAITFAVEEGTLFEFDRVYSGFPCVLFTEDVSKVILCTKVGYLIFAGPQDFVEAAVGGSFQQAKETFANYAAGWSDEALGSHLTSIKNKYFGDVPSALIPGT